MDVLLRPLRALPWERVRQFLSSQSASRFAAGGVLGLLAACTLMQWNAVWGSSGPWDRGLAFALITSLLLGSAIQKRTCGPAPLWLMLVASLSLLAPWWISVVAGLSRHLPTETALSPMMLEIIAASIALASLCPLVTCWSGFLSAWQTADEESTVAPRTLLLETGAGIGCGILLVAFVTGPVWGLEITAILGSACGLAIGLRSHRLGTTPTTTESNWVHTLHTPATGSIILAAIGAVLCGGVISVQQDFLQHLLPQAAALELSQLAVVVIGITLGLGIAWRMSSRRQMAAWCLIGLAMLCGVNGFLFEIGLKFRLWSAAYLTQTSLHQFAQLSMIIAACGLPAVVVGVLLGVTRKTPVILLAAALCLGVVLGDELSLIISPRWIIAGAAGGCCLMAAVELLRGSRSSSQGWRPVITVAGLCCVTLLAWLPAELDSARPAKLLFSTQTFLGYRSGWTVGQLPHLDDARVIDQRAGRQGMLTLWMSRGQDLLLREAGIPRSAISANPARAPQPAAEVLQAVFPLLVAQRSREVLLLGASGGMPLTVCLEFPVEHITCVEPDAARMALIRGPLAAARGVDPFADERVTLDSRPVELAAAMSDGGYDIVVSSPPLSALANAAPQFTEEFYRNVSRKLSEHGLFCQRWEGIDYGPLPMQLVAGSLVRVFQHVAAIEIGVGEYLFLATNSTEGLVQTDLPDRLETVHVRRVLAQCGWDWSTLLTLPAWDQTALKEFASDGTRSINTAANCRLAFVGPVDMLRWAPKLYDTQQLLTKNRTNPLPNENGETPQISRRSRYLDWLGDQNISQDVLRRLSEVAALGKLVGDGPDTCWLDYRKALRDELQQRPRTEIRQVAATQKTQRMLHKEDERRKQYFIDLGVAGDLKHRRLEAVYELQRYFEPYDPLLSLFARQEMADLLKYYGHPDPATELNLRLHVVNFAPANDRSLQNVLTATELLLDEPEAMTDSQNRFDTLNGLLQTLRTRWEMRSSSQVKSVRLAIQDVDRTLIVIENALSEMDQLAAQPEVAAAEWSTRRDVLDRLLLRPLRGYRAELVPVHLQNKTTSEAAQLEAKLKRKQ